MSETVDSGLGEERIEELKDEFDAEFETDDGDGLAFGQTPSGDQPAAATIAACTYFGCITITGCTLYGCFWWEL